VLPLGAAPTSDNDEGYVTSVVYSPTVGSWIGLALVKGGAGRLGARMRAYDPVRNGDVEIELVSPIFVDPKGERLHA
jgi:sarcosine oxidase subunit alpha